MPPAAWPPSEPWPAPPYRPTTPRSRDEFEAQRRAVEAALPQVCPKQLRWIQRLAQEYPSVDLMRISSIEGERMALTLFGDEDFVPAWGHRFDELGTDRLMDLVRDTWNRCSQHPDYRIEFHRYPRAFINRMTLPHWSPHVGVRVQALRAVREEVGRLRADLQRPGGEAAALERLRALEREPQGAYRLLWPSERAELAGAMQAAQGRASEATLAANMAPLFAAANTVEGLAALRDGLARQRTLLAAVSPATRAALEQRVQQQVADALPRLLEPERALMATLPADAAGLERGTVWLRQFQSRFAAFRGEPAVAALEAAYLANRAAQVNAAMPAIGLAVEQAPTLAELEAVLDRYLPLPADRRQATFVPVQELAQQRRQVLQREAIVAASGHKDAVAACDAYGGHPDDPGKGAPPGVTDAELDVVRALEACSAARDAQPGLPRLAFQFGRALWKAELFAEAIEELSDAAAAGHGAALAYLADAALFGAGGTDPDPELAKRLYQRAAAAGFRPAAALASEIIAGVTAVPPRPEPLLEYPAAIDALANGRFQLGPGLAGLDRTVYLLGAVYGAGHHCPELIPPGYNPEAVLQAEAMRIVGQALQSGNLLSMLTAADSARVQRVNQAGIDDGYAYAATRESCRAEEVRTLVQTAMTAIQAR